MIRKIIKAFEDAKIYKDIARKQAILLNRIVHKCNQYQQLNCSLSYTGFQRIKDIALSDLDENYSTEATELYLQDDRDNVINYGDIIDEAISIMNK